MVKTKGPQEKVQPSDDKGQISEVSQQAVELLPTTKPTVVDESIVEEAVSFINEKANETLYRGSEEIGAYLLEKFFKNDIKVASSRRPYKSASYAALCQREDLAVHPATLSLMVRVAAQESFFKDKGFDPVGLSYTHKAELVKLPNTEEKIRLAQKAMESTFTTRLLSEEVKKAREKSGGKGKIVVSVIEKYLSDPVRLFENRRRNEFVSSLDNFKKIRPEARQRIREKALEMVERAKEWGERYAAIVKELEKI